MADNSKPTIVIKKIKKAAHGAHGGAWKVAYADFVTAMMAFFLLLWLLSSVSTEKLTGIADYFTPTVGLRDEMGIGFNGGTSVDTIEGTKKNVAASKSIIEGSPTVGPVIKNLDGIDKQLDDASDAKNFTNLQNDLYKAIHNNPELKEFKDNIIVDDTPEGLRIQITDKENRPMFFPGTSDLQDYTKKVLTIIAKYIKFLPNYLAINGHTATDKTLTYDNWALSASRANAARKFFVDGLLDPEQISRITGKADQEPLDAHNPSATKNMRISLILLKNTIMPFQKQSAPEEALFYQEDLKRSK